MLKQFLIPLLIIVTVVLVYMGAYLPVKKSAMYISTTGNAGSFESIQQLKDSYNKVFEFNSPVGHEETVKFFLNTVSGTVQKNSIGEESAKELVEFGESKMVEGSFLNILTIANMYNILWQRFDNEYYFKKSEEYYLQAHEIGPKVPQPLFALYQMYKQNNKQQKLTEIRNKLSDLWPNFQDAF